MSIHIKLRIDIFYFNIVIFVIIVKYITNFVLKFKI